MYCYWQGNPSWKFLLYEQRKNENVYRNSKTLANLCVGVINGAQLYNFFYFLDTGFAQETTAMLAALIW